MLTFLSKIFPMELKLENDDDIVLKRNATINFNLIRLTKKRPFS